jgi:hypothetical protein
MNWSNLLDSFGRDLLRKLGEDPDYLPTHYNPITNALKEPDFVGQLKEMEGFTRVALSRVATICQMVIYDERGGPEGDGKPKALRRHWYSWYKGDFAQPLAFALGDTEINGQGIEEMKDIAWTQRLSNTYADFVDGGQVTYKDLWVEDASRMMDQNWERLFKTCHIILAVEKDSLFSDFAGASKALGAVSLYSGKGKSSKAATEKLLRDHFGWRPGYDPFRDDPLIVLHITDYDYDGEAVIGPTFAEQARRYTTNILEARVGIKPVQVPRDEWAEKWYQVKVSNQGYQSWAENKALFMARCECGHTWPVVGILPEAYWLHEHHVCPRCGENAHTIKLRESTPHGFEVEAMTSRDYRRLIVRALLEVLPFDYIVKKLREECTASAIEAARIVAQDIYDGNDRYQELLAEFERLEEIKAGFESDVEEALAALGEPHVGDWESDDNDPEPEDFERHVEGASDWGSPWRPFDRHQRTESLAAYLRKRHFNEIDKLAGQWLDF